MVRPGEVKYLPFGQSDCFKIKKRRRSNVVEKFRKVSHTVWIVIEAVIIEKTIKEE